MRDAVRGVVVGLAVLALAGAIASRAGWIATDVPRPDGSGAWLLSRATGLAAFVALGLDVIAGLLVSTRFGERWIARGPLIDLHGWLSPLALVLVAGHALVLLADGYVRFDLVDVIVPFAASTRRVAVGLGVIAAYLAIAIHVSFGLRRRIGTKVWRRLHYVSFAAFALAAVHGILAGTDADRGAVRWLLAAPLAIVGLLVAYRIAVRRSGGTRPR